MSLMLSRGVVIGRLQGSGARACVRSRTAAREWVLNVDWLSGPPAAGVSSAGCCAVTWPRLHRGCYESFPTALDNFVPRFDGRVRETQVWTTCRLFSLKLPCPTFALHMHSTPQADGRHGGLRKKNYADRLS